MLDDYKGFRNLEFKNYIKHIMLDDIKKFIMTNINVNIEDANIIIANKHIKSIIDDICEGSINYEYKN